ncbi:MAG: hypothetical protein Q8P30_02345 [Candidatus Uhrbacteria bacterium]|nr:hypothetical protein [Candidatus Uhrbacteria bacterium]
MFKIGTGPMENEFFKTEKMMEKIYILMRADSWLCPDDESEEPYGKVVDVFACLSDAQRECKRLNEEHGDEHTWFDVLEKSIHVAPRST